MNFLKEIKLSSSRLKSSKITSSCTKQLYRHLNEGRVGSVNKITDIYLTPGQQSIKSLNKIDKGNAEQLSKIKLIYQHGSGYYSLMPFLYKSYAKLVKAIELHMNAIGGQRILMPSLYQIELLHESDRFEVLKNELFTLMGRNNKELYLAPTHEEPMTSIISSNHLLNYKQLPILLYQIDSKFRNELRPRFGLLRSNQFIMKDLYSFDKDQASAIRSYEKVCQSYVDLFNFLELDFVKVMADNGQMGGKFSHEFHLLSKYGEDDVYSCDNCKIAYNKETLNLGNDGHHGKSKSNEQVKDDDHQCPQCKNTMKHSNSIEIGHTFYLGTKYSEKMNALFIDNINQQDGKSNDVETTIDETSSNQQHLSTSNKKPLEMCCFGIGVTRLLSAFITQQTDQLDINWPLRIAPYHVLIIPPKRGSKQNIDDQGDKFALNISNALKMKGFDVLIDNRSYLTIGRREIDSLAYGFPFKIIIGRESINEIPKFEFKSKDEKANLTHAELLDKFDRISRAYNLQ